MGHPFVLKATEQLLATKSFIPTWDSLVFKVWREYDTLTISSKTEREYPLSGTEMPVQRVWTTSTLPSISVTI
jgi:hypothetical protein